MPPSYPQTFDLSQAPAAGSRNSQVSMPQGNGRTIRAPSISVTAAVHNPHLSTITGGQHDCDSGWELVPTGNGPDTETGGSQTTTTDTNTTAPPVVDGNGASNAGSGLQSGLSEPNVHALGAVGSSLAAQGPGTNYSSTMSGLCAKVKGMNASNMGTSRCSDENTYGTANTPRAEHEISHMATWAEETLNELHHE
ncbi:hypothetical protein TARUN_5338 [Trichoderma arundinaceum]|uniref:Uncharacterized protein n=1 Tax=Trichoderma arundinaceum TaxID=490622 RepID=A0A395NLG8_TRIAR|nr:hypothetical protein TARUN_5338 [Trichoderma arundinaceum]